jgi:hypothetical protein
VNSFCTIEYGYFTAFSPCNTGNMVQDFTAGFLLGQQVTIGSSITVTHLGVIGNAGGAQGILALYNQDGTGKPSTLVTKTAAANIVAGSNTIPVATSANVAAGTYWIMAEYSATSSICVDTSTSNQIYYVSESFGTVPTTFPSPLSEKSVDINYYVVGQD